jgi:hypothetical protein
MDYCEPPSPAAANAEDEATEAVDRVTERIRVMPARTFCGAGGEGASLDTFLDGQSDIPASHQDWPERSMNRFVAELASLAAAKLSTAW